MPRPARASLHWAEYLMEAAGLGAFMVSASLVTVLVEHPQSAFHSWVPSAFGRRVVIGTAMGLTAMALVYSPWGRRSGAHLNPSVTLTFLRLGKVKVPDAIGYVTGQVVGGVAGLAVAARLLGPLMSAPSINYVATVPGAAGSAAAFVAETVISFALMTTVLAMSRSKAAPLTGIAAGLLVAAFIALEAPFSGMSMNPARTLASSLVGGATRGLWIYFVAPPLGMLAAAELVLRTRGRHTVHCAKLHHGHGPCLFCGSRIATTPVRTPGGAFTAAVVDRTHSLHLGQLDRRTAVDGQRRSL